jgi:hypothetical protein
VAVVVQDTQAMVHQQAQMLVVMVVQVEAVEALVLL